MELLVRIVDKISADPEKNAQLTKAGDVIAYHEDGADWGMQEILNPDWRIVHIQNLPQDIADSLVAPEASKDLNNTSKMLQRRAVKIDFDLIEKLSKKSINKTSRHGKPIGKPVDIEIDGLHLVSAIVVKKPLPESDAIGAADAVIG